MTVAARKLFAGPRVRRLRAARGLTQTRMAEALGVSVSYLNLIEANQRPVTASVLLKLSDLFDVDARALAADDDEALAGAVADALAADGVGRREARDFVENHPAIARALLARRAAPAEGDDPAAVVRSHILSRNNHFPALEAHAEALADELRLAGGQLGAALAGRLRVRHALSVRVLPVEVMPGALMRLDWHARQVQLSESLDGASRTFQAAMQLGRIEAKAEIAAEVDGSGLEGPAARLLQRNLMSYWAAALIMPYARFHAAAEALRYDLELLQARFGAGFEQVAHRLTTLQRPGARGVPFVMLRADRAGQISKRLASARLPFAESGGHCPLWVLHAAFEQPTRILTQVAELPSGGAGSGGQRIFTVARTVRPQAAPWGGVQPRFAIALSCGIDHAASLVYAGDAAGPAAAIGPGCAACPRVDCRQRSLPPAGARLSVDPTARGLSPFQFNTEEQA